MSDYKLKRTIEAIEQENLYLNIENKMLRDALKRVHELVVEPLRCIDQTRQQYSSLSAGHIPISPILGSGGALAASSPQLSSPPALQRSVPLASPTQATSPIFCSRAGPARRRLSFLGKAKDTELVEPKMNPDKDETYFGPGENANNGSEMNLSNDATFFEEGENECVNSKSKCEECEVEPGENKWECMDNLLSSKSISSDDAETSTHQEEAEIREQQRSTKEVLITSYDRLPGLSEMLALPHHSTKVLGKKRKSLPGWPCQKCEEYYQASGLDNKAVCKCSRHRSVFKRQPSPKGFWSLDMPSTQWIRERAMGFQTQE